MTVNRLHMKFLPAILVFTIGIIATSCTGGRNSDTLLNDSMKEINGKDSPYKNFRVYNTDTYYALEYRTENTPANQAKIVWLGNHEELEKEFHRKILAELQEGEILARVVKEKKALVFGVSAGETEYHAVIPPAEIVETVFKK